MLETPTNIVESFKGIDNKTSDTLLEEGVYTDVRGLVSSKSAATRVTGKLLIDSYDRAIISLAGLGGSKLVIQSGTNLIVCPL